MKNLDSQSFADNCNTAGGGRDGVLTPGRFLTLTVDEVRRAVRYDRPLSVALIRVDGLGAIRGKDGGAAAEEIVAAIAGRIAVGCRALDRLARLDPDELGLLMPETRLKDAHRMAERLRRSAWPETGRFADDCPVTTLSFGLAAVSPRLREPCVLMLTAAAELRKARSAGGDQVSLAAPDAIVTTTRRSDRVH